MKINFENWVLSSSHYLIWLKGTDASLHPSLAILQWRFIILVSTFCILLVNCKNATNDFISTWRKIVSRTSLSLWAKNSKLASMFPDSPVELPSVEGFDSIFRSLQSNATKFLLDSVQHFFYNLKSLSSGSQPFQVHVSVKWFY